MTLVPAVSLNNGVLMPMLGFGVYQMTNATECEAAVLSALEAGYRLIDTAAAYGNEEAVGRAIAKSGIPRKDIFLTTKLWVSDAGPHKTRAAFERSLSRLGLDYIDLYLIHQPYNDVHGAWRVMEQLYEDGSARAIGVSNFQPDRLMDLIEFNRVTPAVNQIETHPFHQQKDVQDFLKGNNVQIQSWGPFAEGRNNLFSNPVLAAIAQTNERTVAQVTLRWLFQRGVISIPKSVRKERIAENFDIFDFQLSSADMASISGLDINKTAFADHRDPSAVRAVARWRVPT